MKRILALGCSIALAAMLLAGCGNGGNNEQPSGGEGTGIAVEDVKVGVIHIGDPATGSGTEVPAKGFPAFCPVRLVSQSYNCSFINHMMLQKSMLSWRNHQNELFSGTGSDYETGFR